MVSALRIDLNADVGESFGTFVGQEDEALLALVTTAHVACGFHAGDPATMRATVRTALAHDVAIGAHPSYPDLVGFGRRAMDVAPARVADDVLYQLGALEGIARSLGGRVSTVKPHGALYHRVGWDEPCAAALIGAVRDHGGLAVVLPAGSPALDVAASLGVPALAEAFCDRGYRQDGTLADRSEPGGVLTDPAEAARRAVSLVVDHMVTALDGSELWMEVDTLCIHGDTPGARVLGVAVRRALEEAGVGLAAPVQIAEG